MLLSVAALVGGTVALIGLAGGVETHGREFFISPVIERQLEYDFDEPIIAGLTPGPLAAWSWADHVRAANCPACLTPSPGAEQAFYEWYSLVPPLT